MKLSCSGHLHAPVEAAGLGPQSKASKTPYMPPLQGELCIQQPPAQPPAWMPYTASVAHLSLTGAISLAHEESSELFHPSLILLCFAGNSPLH